MTDDPTNKATIKATFILCAPLPPALALLAGCKSEPQKTGYLYLADNEVIFFEWTRTGRKIEGTLEGWTSGPGYKPQYSVPFKTEAEAQTAGYRKAKNCPQ